MTPEELRKIDAEIAERVMGYRLKREDCNTYWVDSDGNEPMHGHNYSTDMTAAWEVVDHFKCFVTLSKWNIEHEWRCEIKNGMGSVHVGEAPTAALAICLAALTALEKTPS